MFIPKQCHSVVVSFKGIIQGCTTIYIVIYKQLYVISFLFFDNPAIVSRATLFTLSDNVTR